MSGAFGDSAQVRELFSKRKKPKPPLLTEEEKKSRRQDYYRRTRAARLMAARRYRATHPDKIVRDNKYQAAKRRAARRNEPAYMGRRFSELTRQQRRFYAARYSKGRQRYMYFAEYQVLARRTQNTGLSRDEQFKHALFGMTSELGEIAGVFQKQYQGHKVNPVALIHELGDLLWFMSEFCDVAGFDLEDVAKTNIQKLRERYPEGFDEERSLNREEE